MISTPAVLLVFHAALAGVVIDCHLPPAQGCVALPFHSFFPDYVCLSLSGHLFSHFQHDPHNSLLYCAFLVFWTRVFAQWCSQLSTGLVLFLTEVSYNVNRMSWESNCVMNLASSTINRHDDSRTSHKETLILWHARFLLVFLLSPCKIRTRCNVCLGAMNMHKKVSALQNLQRWKPYGQPRITNWS